jgi:predicted short-subunit dehydrogenase-like oxidoreductase (DUF2520 family)
MNPLGFPVPATDPIGIAGPGRLGQALGRTLHDRGQPVAAIAGRDFSRTLAAAKFIGPNVQAVALEDLPARAGRILLTVPDDALPSVTRTLAAAPEPVMVALHTSGSRGPEALKSLEDRGASCGALHPLQTIATPEQGVSDLPGSFFGITAPAGSKALTWALEICSLLDGHVLTISPECRPLYHAAAVMASNYVVAMIDAAVILMEEAGIEQDRALPALAPLIRASVENSLAAGPVQALTGPIERGDEQTVAMHLRALDHISKPALESIRQLYRCAGLQAIAIAQRRSPAIDRQTIQALLRGELEP